MTAIHRLKSWPALFNAVATGAKRFDLRRNDRPFAVGDTVILEEWSPDTQRYSGRTEARVITYITSAAHPCALSEAGLAPGFCILSLSHSDGAA